MQVQVVPPSVLEHFGLDSDSCSLVNGGLINWTYRAQSVSRGTLLLQRINTSVFTRPDIIAQNVDLAASYLATEHPEYLFLAPLETASIGEEGVWRIFHYLDESKGHSWCSTEGQAYAAAKQFGELSRRLSECSLDEFREPLPHFHDLAMILAAFEEAVTRSSTSHSDRREQASDVTNALTSVSAQISRKYTELLETLPMRLVHRDAKIGNVLFRANDEGLCACDLDTLAPGRIFSDLGDLFRTIVSPVSEEEADCSKVHVRPLFFRAVVSGWLSEMAPLLTPSEMDNIAFSGILIVFMQALRFCTDFLSGDVYYKVSHRLHNLDRARNQVALLTNMLDQQQTLDAIVKEELALAKHRKD